MNIQNSHDLRADHIKLPNFDMEYLRPKLKKLGKLLKSEKTAIVMFLSITEGLKSKGYIRKHIETAITLLQYHRKRCRDNHLKAFQLSLTKLIKMSKKYHVHFITIIKKIYLHLEYINYFYSEISLKDFNIYELCPANGTEILVDHFRRLELFSKSTEITQTTKQFINSKNVVKNYVRCYADVFEKITRIDPKWSPGAIKLGLEEYRNSFNTESGSLNTKYHETGRAIELFNYLIKIGLVDKTTVLPKNIKKPAYSSLMRSTNPTFSAIDINSLSIENSMTSATVLIDSFHNDLIMRLSCLKATAQKVVADFYNKHPRNVPFPSDGIDSNVIVAMQIIIVDEMGINPTSLYNLQVNIEAGKRSNKEFIKIEADGTLRVNVIKWRQRYLQRRTTRSATVNTQQLLQQQDINASFCIQLAITLTENKRRTLKTNLLWLRKSQKVVRTKNSFDHEFRNFCNTFLPEDFAKLEPTLMKLRSSRAIEIYIASKGDIVKTATYLGNKIKTTLSTYIPLFLQEIIYRRKIHVFQHLYLILATANQPEKQKLLGMSFTEYNKCVKNIYKNDDFGGPLFETLNPKFTDNSNESATEVFFICSPENFAHAIKLIRKSTTETGLKYKVCLDAINKASSGSIVFKSMIIEAEKILEKEGLNLE